MGFVDPSMYTGDIVYTNIPAGQQSYWLIPMTGISVQGVPVSLGNTGPVNVAIDTGTTLIGGPSSAIASIFAQIPGSTPGSGNTAGYWMYPCKTQVTVALTFGGQSWAISPSDFQLAAVSSTMCTAAFFELNMGGSAPSWIIGDTFLKNVVSVFRFNPPSVGFANLSSTAQGLSNINAPVPTPTLGSSPVAPGRNGSTGHSWGIIQLAALLGALAVGAFNVLA